MRENRMFRSGVRKTGALVIATLALGLVCEVTPATTGLAAGPVRSDDHASAPAPSVSVAPPAARVARAGTRTTGRWAGAVNVWSKSAVNSAYWSQYAPKLNLSIDWIGGSVLGCLAGLTGASTNNATLTALNFVRSMAGLAPVSFSPSMNASAQQAALIMDANNALNHHPSSSWRCWTRTGADAASRSNLALAWPTLDAGQIVDLYMDDPGAGNEAAGHRRWVLNPFSTVMGSGSTTTANALTVIGPSSAARPNPRYVGWPTAGYFPNKMEPSGRWSLSAGLRSVSFARARVKVYRNGVQVPVTRYPVHNGYAQPTLVWQLGSSVPKYGSFKVVVTGIKRAGIRRSLSYSYPVNLFTPYAP